MSTLYVSHDAGATWQDRSAPRLCYLISVAVAGSNPATLYAGGIRADVNGSCQPQHAGLDRSTDGGLTWTEADAGLDAGPQSVVRSVAVDPFDSGSSTPASIQTRESGRAPNGGTTWTRIPIGQSFRDTPVLSVSPVDGSVWATDSDQVFVSRDAGATWESVGAPQSLRLFQVVPDPRDANRLYVTGWGGIWLLEL